jgi:NAD(P)-dependent dehydrogenase (short-subunit alcohol dehydrogenase family)
MQNSWPSAAPANDPTFRSNLDGAFFFIRAVSAFLRAQEYGKIVNIRDVAGVVLFLCSEAARHITGTTIPVDGGYLH